MEKRLFLAVFLSLVVVFGFQAFFMPQKGTPPNLPSTQTNATNQKKAFSNDTASNSENLPEKSNLTIETKTFSINNDIFELKVINKGASIDKVVLKGYKYEFPVKNFAEFGSLQDQVFDFQIENNMLVATADVNNLQVIKKITLNDDHTIKIVYRIFNKNKEVIKFNSRLNNFNIDMSRVDKTVVQSDATLYEYSLKINNKIVRKESASKFDEKWNKEETTAVDWVGFRDRYFGIIVKQKDQQNNYFVKNVSATELILGTNIVEVIEPGSSLVYEFKVYAGPQKLDILDKAEQGFSSLMVFSNWGWLDAISKVMYWLLGVLHNLIPSWGLNIILISLIVYGLMYPLTAKSLVSMKKLQALQPQMKEIQEKYKNNPEKLNKEVVELYRINQVNPLGGCLPMLLQMPIFVGLYQVLWRCVYFRGQSFLWIKDLSLPDHTVKLPFVIPFLGEHINILPILMVGIMAVQQNLNMRSMSATTPDQAVQQKMMATVFPILIGFIFYNMASGLNLYFVVFYLLSTITQWKIATNTK